MNRLFTKLSFIGLMALGLTACDKAIETKASTAAESITIINPHIRAMPPGQKVTAMYMQLKNTSANDHHLVQVDGDISNRIELHTHKNDNGVMRMSQVESIPVPPNSTAVAKPGSYHVMIMGLEKDMKIGDNYNFKFIFKDGSSKPVTAEVKKIEMK